MSDPAAPTGLAERLRELHRPGYFIHGVWHDHTVYVHADDLAEIGHDHVCRVGPDPCDPMSGEHQVLACAECRQITEDGDPAFPIWPCATIRAVEGAERNVR